MEKKDKYIGQHFGRLTVVSFDKRKGKHYFYNCVCDCGTKIDHSICIGSIVNGKSRSCGCLKRELLSERRRSIGSHCKTRLYRIWQGMKSRCYYPKDKEYYCYGGRGIKLCPEWRDDFAAFSLWAYEHGYDEKLNSKQCTIDRINTDGDYGPDNCRWVSRAVQNQNKRTNIYIEHNGETHCLSEWARIKGIEYSVIYYKYKKGKRGNKLWEQ